MRETRECDTNDSRDMSVTFDASFPTDDNKECDEDEKTCLEYHLSREDRPIFMTREFND